MVYEARDNEKASGGLQTVEKGTSRSLEGGSSLETWSRLFRVFGEHIRGAERYISDLESKAERVRASGDYMQKSRKKTISDLRDLVDKFSKRPEKQDTDFEALATVQIVTIDAANKKHLPTERLPQLEVNPQTRFNEIYAAYQSLLKVFNNLGDLANAEVSEGMEAIDGILGGQRFPLKLRERYDSAFVALNGLDYYDNPNGLSEEEAKDIEYVGGLLSKKGGASAHEVIYLLQRHGLILNPGE